MIAIFPLLSSEISKLSKDSALLSINRFENLKKKEIFSGKEDVVIDDFTEELEEVSYSYLSKKFEEFVLEIEDKLESLEYKKVNEKKKKKNLHF